MSSVPIKINFPVHISQVKAEGKIQFQARPLFFRHSNIIHTRYDAAIRKLANSIQNGLQGTDIDTGTIKEINWLRFLPKIDFQVYDLTIPLKGKKTKNGKFALAIFELQNLKIGCLPKFDNFMFVFKKNEKGKIDIQKRLYL